MFSARYQLLVFKLASPFCCCNFCSSHFGQAKSEMGMVDWRVYYRFCCDTGLLHPFSASAAMFGCLLCDFDSHVLRVPFSLIVWICVPRHWLGVRVQFVLLTFVRAYIYNLICFQPFLDSVFLSFLFSCRGTQSMTWQKYCIVNLMYYYREKLPN